MVCYFNSVSYDMAAWRQVISLLVLKSIVLVCRTHS